ncbi:uncharacterized protein At4g15970-like [Hordeum vulgare subsp. vulgare]|uniref:Nucleotide-diphospho-sugar transferase domain-containing protein n=1 Tax=Hordeum vulgare subsp. vulgare TaxID=112509 RepID=A0A8I6XAT4_HORVV|nr:uncharacterized protein At4g15970-like [Hordeum vulgare subsp. vulgare]
MDMGGSPRKQHGGVGGSHSASFLLGALLPTILLFFLASDRVGERLASISSLGNNDGSSAAHQQTTHANHTGTEERLFPGLAELLPRVATDDGTVIITSVNEAWSRPGSLLDLFREGFKNGEGIAHLLSHTLIVAVDAGALAHCEAVHPHCYLLEVTAADVSSANRFMTKSYLELVWAKLELQQRVLQLGYSYLFTDVDIMWLRNPFRHISLYADMAVSTDRFNGDAEALTNAPNTGFYYVRSTNRTVEMLRRWRAARSRFPPTHDQAVFDEIKGELAAGELRIRFVFLETALFDGFCQLHGEMDRVCTMHANCCIGLENKVHDLRNVAADWKNYTSMAPPERTGGGRRWTAPAQCEASMRQR